MSFFPSCTINIPCKCLLPSKYIHLQMIWFFFTLHSPSQVGLHGTVWNQGPEGIFSRAPASVSNTLHGWPRLHQWHRDLHSVGQWQGPYRLGQRALGKNKRTGGDQRWSPKFKCAPVSLGQYSPRWAVRGANFIQKWTNFVILCLCFWILFRITQKAVGKRMKQTVHIWRSVILQGTQLQIFDLITSKWENQKHFWCKKDLITLPWKKIFTLFILLCCSQKSFVWNWL